MRSLATLMALAFTLVGVAAYSDDASFYDKAARGGMAEVAAGRLAATKGTSGEVRDFGAMMVKDHEAANRKLADIAKAKGISLPRTAGEAQLAEYKSLQAQDGARFDSAYLAGQVKAHEETVRLLKSEIASGKDPQAKVFAQEILPAVQSHLEEAYRLTGQPDRSASLPK